MTEPATPDPSNLAGEVLSALAPVLGLRLDASRVELLRPLAGSLLRMGLSLSATLDPSLEPLEMGGVPTDVIDGGR